MHRVKKLNAFVERGSASGGIECNTGWKVGEFRFGCRVGSQDDSHGRAVEMEIGVNETSASRDGASGSGVENLGALQLQSAEYETAEAITFAECIEAVNAAAG